METKRSLCRDLENEEKKLLDFVYKTISREQLDESEEFSAVLCSNVQWNTIRTYEKRVKRLIGVFPALAPCVEFLERAAVAAELTSRIVHADKERKLAKRVAREAKEKAEAEGAILKSGAKIGRASKEDIETLLSALADERKKHIEDAVASANESLDLLIKLSESNVNWREAAARRGVFVRTRPELSGEELRKSVSVKAKRSAEYEFDSYVIKLAHKIVDTKTGPINKATLRGSAWSGSTLTVITTETQIWHTKRIVNTSPLGNGFYQWPTTRG